MFDKLMILLFEMNDLKIFSDLRCLYELLIRVPNGIETITNTMKQIIQDKCSMITVSNANNTGRESAVVPYLL